MVRPIATGCTGTGRRRSSGPSTGSTTTCPDPCGDQSGSGGEYPTRSPSTVSRTPRVSRLCRDSSRRGSRTLGWEGDGAGVRSPWVANVGLGRRWCRRTVAVGRKRRGAAVAQLRSCVVGRAGLTCWSRWSTRRRGFTPTRRGALGLPSCVLGYLVPPDRSAASCEGCSRSAMPDIRRAVLRVGPLSRHVAALQDTRSPSRTPPPLISQVSTSPCSPTARLPR